MILIGGRERVCLPLGLGAPRPELSTPRHVVPGPHGSNGAGREAANRNIHGHRECGLSFTGQGTQGETVDGAKEYAMSKWSSKAL